MGRRLSKRDQDRYLHTRDGNYHYRRKVPATVGKLDPRYPHVRISMKTDDLAIARAKRDAYEAADEAYWSSLILGRSDGATAHEAAIRRAEALNFAYKTSQELASSSPVYEIVQRFKTVEHVRPTDLSNAALLGGELPEPVKLSKAFDTYCEKIAAAELAGKSPKQKDDWKKVKQRAVDNLIAVLKEDKALLEITRDDALKFHKFWSDKITGKERLSPNSGNRDVGNVRALIRAWLAYFDIRDHSNPFDGLRFEDKFKKSRPPFTVQWLQDHILKVDALSTLNVEARRIVLTLIETGARPSEICNLRPHQIVLDHEIPHLSIEPLRGAGIDAREIKTTSSVRKIPLIGVSLAAMKASPNGFPRYHDKETSLSAVLMKHFRTKKLLPTAGHSIYSIRHSFEDRMKEAGLDTELRKLLMGHSNERPKYGEGGQLRWRRDELLKIELAFDPAIV